MPPATPDGTLCSFYNASLNTTCRALSSEDGPRGIVAAYVEWTLARNGSPLTVCPEDDLARSTPDPGAQPTISLRSTSPSPPMTESYFPPRSASQSKAEQLSGRSSRKLSPTRQIRCESRRQCPPRGSQPWTV